MKRKPTTEQQAIINAIKGGATCIAVDALAGTGKTTIIGMCIEALSKLLAILYLCFNKAIRVEAQERFAQLVHVTAHTLNSYGWSLFRENLRKFLKLEKGDWKMVNIFQNQLKVTDHRFTLAKMCAAMKNAAWGIEGGTPATQENLDKLIVRYDIGLKVNNVELTLEQAFDLCTQGLAMSNELAKKGHIDYNDQVYCPLVFGWVKPLEGWVMVDERQDLNLANRITLQRLVGPKTKLLMVGDENQAIFGFRGAEYDSCQVLDSLFNPIKLPLTVNFRCDKAIIKEANPYVPELKAWDGAGEGLVDNIGYNAFMSIVSKLKGDSTILCRNNAPIAKLWMRLVRAGVRCYVVRTELEEQLISLAKNNLESATLDGKLMDLSKYQEARELVIRAKFKNPNPFVSQLTDQCDTLRVLLTGAINSGASDMAGFEGFVRSMFGDKRDRGDILSLSTIHKAKGCEWNNVYFLNRSLIPSPYAKQAAELKQEDNLAMIGITRAKHELHYLEIDFDSLPKDVTPKAKETQADDNGDEDGEWDTDDMN